VAAERDSPLREQPAGLDQDEESLLLDQPADGEHAARDAPVGRRRLKEREVDAVVGADELLLESRDTVADAQQRVTIELAHGDHERGASHLHTQDVLVDLVVVDVLGVCREAVGDSEERARQHRHVRGPRREVGV